MENFFLLLNLSVLYQRPLIVVKDNGAFGGLSPTARRAPLLQKTKPDTNAIGANGTLNFAYYVPAAHLTIALGFRYQFFYMLTGRSANFVIVGEMDHFYGINLSAVFSFNFAKKKPVDNG